MSVTPTTTTRTLLERIFGAWHALMAALTRNEMALQEVGISTAALHTGTSMLPDVPVRQDGA